MNGRVVSSNVVRGAHHVTRHNTPIHNILSTARKLSIATHHVLRHNTPIQNILSTAPHLNISQKALGTLPEDGNGATIPN